MKPVKLSEVKVGDVIWDQKEHGHRMRVIVKAITFVLLKVDEKPKHDYLLDENGLARFSAYSSEDFYIQNQ